MTPGSFAWATGWPPWNAPGKLVGEHPVAILAVDAVKNEMWVAICATETQRGATSIHITPQKFASAFKPQGVLGHATNLFLQSASGTCVLAFPISEGELKFPLHPEPVRLRRVRALSRPDWERLRLAIRAMSR